MPKSTIIPVNITAFNGGLLEDKRLGWQYSGGWSTKYYSLVKHFDAFTYPKKLVPNYKTVPAGADSPATQRGYNILQTIYAPYEGVNRLYGLGVASGHPKLFMQDLTANLDTVIWATADNGACGSGTQIAGMFFYYKDYLYFMESSTRISRFKVTATTTALGLCAFLNTCGSGGGGGGVFGGGGGTTNGALTAAGGSGGGSGYINPTSTITNATTTLGINSSGNGWMTVLFNAPVSGFYNVAAGGSIVTGGLIPTITSCGTLSVISGNNNAGIITPGSGSPSTCQLNFASPYFYNLPACTVTSNGVRNYLWITSESTSSIVINASTSLSTSNFINYTCLGY